MCDGGSGVNGQTVTVKVIDSGSTVVDTLTGAVAGGAWSVSLSAGQATSLADGTYSISPDKIASGLMQSDQALAQIGI